MAKWAAARGVPLVHLSTDYVFNGSGERPWREDDPVAPLSAYGASKLAGEENIRSAAGPHLIVRTSWIYSASGTNFLRTISRLARERDELKIVADQIGAPTSAAFVAETLAMIVRKNPSGLASAFASSRRHPACRGRRTHQLARIRDGHHRGYAKAPCARRGSTYSGYSEQGLSDQGRPAPELPPRPDAATGYLPDNAPALESPARTRIGRPLTQP